MDQRHVPIKTDQEIEKMRQSGQLLAQLFTVLEQYVKPGLSTMEINQWVERYIINQLNARPASIGQYGYPYAINCSINNEACHGIPLSDRILKSSDIINLDITLEKEGWIADSSKMFIMPDSPHHARKLVSDTYQAMWVGIKQVKPGAYLGDVGYAIQSYIESLGYNIVREYCGHGIGQRMHEPPQVLHFGLPQQGLLLQPGMTFTIEPIVNQGSRKVHTLSDGWTVVTDDNRLSAQFEHTVLVTDSGVEVLTLRPDELHLVS
ncbi:type I methionyl aminopeptidase [Vibrio sinensis]|uniref:Methionine aminopeptidase n=1 Tax=Vibrio sinensis TaxID=2302434 RepID=A0A3A6R5I4_9VIBR|nr:type I methionyl aminopeptidase [Vibrio sinensis]RJX71639.1 type I methionyl aminopeptidase [Vibrio sinensis]